MGDQKSINAQLSQRIDNVENTLNKMMDGMQNDLSQKIDNLQYSISRLTNLNTVQEKGRFPSQPHQMITTKKCYFVDLIIMVLSTFE